MVDFEGTQSLGSKMSATEVIECLRDPAYQRRGFGLVITGSSRDERSAMANSVLRQRVEAGHSYLSLTPFEVVAANCFGQGDRLSSVEVLLINDLGELSEAEKAALDVIKPIFSVAATLENILDRRYGNEVTTLVTTEYELPELAVQFSPRLTSLISGIGFSIRLDGKDGEFDADRS